MALSGKKWGYRELGRSGVWKMGKIVLREKQEGTDTQTFSTRNIELDFTRFQVGAWDA